MTYAALQATAELTSGPTRRPAATGSRALDPDQTGHHLAARPRSEPLTDLIGAPVRLVAPGYRGFWWVKWVPQIKLTDVPAWRQLPFPPQ